MRPLLVVLLLVVPLLVGCSSLVRMRERSLERSLRRADLRERVVELGPDTLHVWEGGEGEPVVLVHGFGGSALWQWHHVAPRLAEDYRVLAPDLLWFGESSSSARDFALSHQVSALAALLRHDGIAHAQVVGTSYGGFVAWELAHRHPDLVARLVLVDSPGPAFSRADYEAMLQRLRARDAVEVFVPDDPDDVQRLIDLAYFDPPQPPRSLRAAILRELYAPHATEQRELMRRLVVDELERAPEIDAPPQPVAIIWGAHDPVFPVANAHALARVVHTDVQIIDRARHAPMLEHPDRFEALLLAALRGR